MKKPPDRYPGVEKRARSSTVHPANDSRAVEGEEINSKRQRFPTNRLRRPCLGWSGPPDRTGVPKCPPRLVRPSAARRWREPSGGPRRESPRPMLPHKRPALATNSHRRKADARRQEPSTPRLASPEHPLIPTYSSFVSSPPQALAFPGTNNVPRHGHARGLHTQEPSPRILAPPGAGRINQ